MKHLFFLLALTMSAFPAKAALFGNEGVQVQEYLYDFAVDGGATGAVDISHGKNLPAGAQVLDVYYLIETAFTSGGSATVALGDVASASRYKSATAYNDSAYALDTIAKAASGVPLNVTSANAGKPQVTIATATLTAGKMKVFYVYMQPKN